jgi:hypothetical protein
VLPVIALAAVLATLNGQAASVVLELRVFDGPEEVTRQVRATRMPGDAPIEVALPEGIYDAQVFHEVEGKVLNIRWANRLVVMRYPDEGGRHLEVVNFRNGYGALQVRTATGAPVQVAAYAAGRRDRPAAEVRTGPGYWLFVLPAGSYDVQVRDSGKVTWHSGIEVPLDRTRFWVVPEAPSQ